MMRTFSTWLLVLALAALTLGCSRFATRATQATGLCVDEDFTVWDYQGGSTTRSWYATCQGANYKCQALTFDEVPTWEISCEYQPICSNDGYYSTTTGSLER